MGSNASALRITLLAAASACIAALGTALPAVAAPSTGAQPTQYRYALEWSPRSRILAGAGAVTVHNTGPNEIRSIWMTMRPNRGERLATITRVRDARLRQARSNGSAIELVLAHPLAVGASKSLRFHYRLVLPRANTSLGRSLGIDLFGDALPTLVVAGARGLRLGAEPAYGEGSLNAVANWRVQVRTPRRLDVAMTGSGQHKSRSHTKVTTSAARVRDFAFAIGTFSTRSARVGAVNVRVVASGEPNEKLDSALRRAVHSFGAIQSWYGGYSLPELDVVIGNLSFGGSEFPGIVFSTHDLGTISHEIAHQWFYGLVGNDQYFEPWLDESLTAFTEQRLAPSYACDLSDPLGGYSHGLSTSMRYWSRHVQAYEHTIYRGGACALRVLRRDIGAVVFDQVMRGYVATNANGIADTKSFLDAVTRAAPNYDLKSWMRLVRLRP